MGQKERKAMAKRYLSNRFALTGMLLCICGLFFVLYLYVRPIQEQTRHAIREGIDPQAAEALPSAHIASLAARGFLHAQLYKAARDGQIEVVQQALRQGTSVDEPFSDRKTM